MNSIMVNVDHESINVIDNNSDVTIGNSDGILNPGETAIIEIPLTNLGSEDVYTKQDGWTVCTKDKQPSAHFEHTITITNDGPRILTI